MIYWEFCKRLKFNHTTKWYIHILESLLEKNTYKNIWDSEIQTNNLTTARRPVLLIENVKKRTYGIVDFTDQAGHKWKIKENKNRDKY